MRVTMTIGLNTFEFETENDSLTSLVTAMQKWIECVGGNTAPSAADALAEKLERQNTGLAQAVAANTPPNP